MKKQFRDFESAREFVQKLNLKSRTEWKEYYKLSNKPDNLPRYPDGVYKNKGWKGWGDFLGNGNVSVKDMQFRSFESAREFAQKLGLKNRDEWQAYCKSGNNPDDIPASAGSIYKKDFKGWGDFLGSGNVKPGDRQYCSFEEARNYVRKLKLKGTKEWQEYCKSGNKPDDIPGHPGSAYPKEFKKNGKWGDWLGTGTIASQNMIFRSFKEARNYVRNLKLKNNAEWKEYCKLGNKPDDIPANPNGTYKKDFEGIPDWLGNGNTRMIPVTYDECRKFAQKNNITKQKEWENFSKSDKRPSNIPGHPRDVYKKEWISWGNFLGTGSIANKNKVYRSFESAREFVRALGLKNHEEWKEYCASGNKPDDIPSAPWNTYKEWKKK